VRSKRRGLTPSRRKHAVRRKNDARLFFGRASKF
jgi:hypothetical protein